MNFFTEHPLFSTAAEALGFTILHSLWQGFLLLFLLALFLRFGKAKSANTRFTVALVTLLLLLAAFGGTFYLQWSRLLPAPATPLSAELPPEAITLATEDFVESAPELPTPANSDTGWIIGLTRLTQLAPWLAWLWVIGSFAFALRLVNGFVQSQRLRYRTQPTSASWQQRAQKLSKRLGINQTILFAGTDRSNTPLTLGWIKPIILIPTGLLTMMPTEQLEAILIHELAHIKRRDYLWNLIQSVAEVILFYHPAYWYISSVLERERELACDHLTVNTTHQPRIYAQALLQVASQSTQVPFQSVAASGKRGLSNRIQQLIYPERTQRGISVLPFFLLLSIISLSLAAFSWYQPELNSSEDNIRPPDYIDYGNIASQLMPLPRFLAYESKDNYLIGHSDFSQKNIKPKTFFQEATLYLLDGEVADDPNSITLNTVRRFEVYYEPLPTPLQNLADDNYSAVVRAFSREYQLADDQKPFNISGQITTREEGKVQPVPGVKLEVKESGKQVFTDDVGKFRMPAPSEGTLIVYWPDETISELEINGREFFHLIAHIPKRRARPYQEIQQRLKQRMSEPALEKDKEVIQRKVNTLDNAINSLQRGESVDTLTRIIRGRVMDAYANQGIEGTTIKASGTTAVTDEKGYYKIHLPIHTKNTVFEFTHPNYDTQRAEVDATVQKALYLSMFKEENQLIIHSERSKEGKKIIQGKVINSSTKEGIVSMVVKASDGTSTITDEQGNYRISLPSTTQETVFEFIHPDYGTRSVEVNAHRENEIFISISKDSDAKSVIRNITQEGLQKIREERKVKGKIVDSQTHKPISGVAIGWITSGKKTTITSTDEQGEYELTVPKDTEVIEYSHPDYQEHFMRDEWMMRSSAITVGMKKLKIESANESDSREATDLLKGEAVDLSLIRSDATRQSTLYVIDSVPQQDRTDLSDLQPEDIASITTVKVKGNRADQFEGLPIEGKGQVVFVTTKDAPLLEEITEKTGSDNLSQIRSDAAGQSPLYIIDGVFVDEPLRNLDPNNIKTIEVIKNPEAEESYGEKAQYGAVLITTKTSSASKIIRGKVIDRKTGEPLPGVNILVKGTTTGTITDRQGKYSINLPVDANELLFTSLGYKRKIAAIQEKEKIDVSLTSSKLPEAKKDSLASLSVSEKTLYIVNGQVRNDINSLDDLDEDIKQFSVNQKDPIFALPPEYRGKGYTRVIRAITRDYQGKLIERTIRGKLIDADREEPLIGAEIKSVKGGENAILAVTDEQGEYQITLPEDVEFLEFFHLGYTRYVMPVRTMTNSFPMRLTLAMEEERVTQRKSKFKSQFRVFPNPGDNEINVEITLEKPISLEFELLDEQGNVVHSAEYHYPNVGSKKVSIPTSRFPANVYLLRIKSGDLSFTRRIILE